MVFTRTQKRKIDDLQQTNAIDENLEVQDDFSNVRLTKKKRIPTKKSVKKTQEACIQTDVDTGVDADVEDSTDDSFINDNDDNDNTDTNTDEEEAKQSTDKTTDGSTDKTTDGSTDKTTDGSTDNCEELDRILYDSDNSQDETEEQSKINYIGSVLVDTIQNVLKQVIKVDNQSDVEPSVKERDEYDKYIKNINSIYEGKFFERVSIDEKKRTLKENVSIEHVAKLNEQLDLIREKYKSGAPSVVDVLNMDVDVIQKQKLLENIYKFTNSEMLTNEYTSTLKSINDKIKQFQNTELLELERKILATSDDLQYSDNYREKILRSEMSFDNKVIAYKRLEVMDSFETTDTSEYAKYKSWMDIMLSIPYNKIVGDTFSTDINLSKQIIKNVREVLDKRLSFLERAKDQIINIVTQTSRNPDFTVNAIGLYGPKGTGKTNLVKSISEALGRPYKTISLGGESDSSLLTGHGFTYVGSCPGRIIEILRETKCTNPIILFDELDKVSETHHGKEIIGNLIHMTDSSTNNKYNYDKYFSGLEFDLSKVLFVFTYNDESKVDPILADRLFKIKVDNYSIKEKLEITKTHLIKSILDQYCFSNDDMQFDENAINYIVELSKSDQGMRDIKRKFEIIVSRVNTLMLTDPDTDIVRLQYKSLYKYFNNVSKPVKILREHIDTLLLDSVSNDTNSDNPPFGMYI
jgi:ATP-dependent Lon protease